MSELIEAYPVTDTFCAGLHKIEDAGDGTLRFLMFVKRGGERHLAASIVMPIAAIPEAILMAVTALAIAGAGVAKAFPTLDMMQ